MTNPENGKPPPTAPNFAERVGEKVARKLEAQQSPAHVWFGLGMMGLIGWSVVVPTLLGAGIGVWLDHGSAGAFSWTLALLLAGLMLGCMNAWHWVAKEDKAMREDRGEHDV
ncbi:MAG: AtpZ/AtpI family protein [Planctomycetota bacterium]